MDWNIYIILYLIFYVIYNQTYKLATRKVIDEGSLTVCIELIGSVVALLFIPFFKIKFPSDYRVYLLFGLAIVFYTIYDRLNTTVRYGLEASTINIINQLNVVFMTILGYLFFRERFVFHKFFGALLILLSNVLVFFKKNSTKMNKYTLIGVFANVCFTIALFLDVNISSQFNMAFYVTLSLLLPGVFIILFERKKVNNLKKELFNGDKIAIVITAVSTTLVSIFQLRAYQLGKVSIVAPLCSLSVIFNVVAGYIFLKEKNNILKKGIAAVLIVIGIILLNN